MQGAGCMKHTTIPESSIQHPASFYLGFFFVNLRVVGFLALFLVECFVSFAGFLVGVGCLAGGVLATFFSGTFGVDCFGAASFCFAAAAPFLDSGLAGAGGGATSTGVTVGRLGKRS